MHPTKKTVVATSARHKPLGGLIDDIWQQREKKRELTKKLEEVDAIISMQEQELLERMDKEGVDKSTGKKASVSVSENMSFNIVEFDQLWKFATKNDYGHLFHRRVTDAACREVFEKKGNVPGLEPYKKRRINIRTLT